MNLRYRRDSKEALPYEHYLKAYEKMDPVDIEKRTGIPFNCETSSFSLRLMGVNYQITHPGFQVNHIGSEEIGWYPLEERANAKILVLRFLNEAVMAPSSGKFLTYREIPWGEVYYKQFNGRCISRLAFGFGDKLKTFANIMKKIGAKELESGDVSFELEFMNDLKLRLILWEGDEEFPPSAQILFSDNFPIAFNQGEDMAVVGDVTIDMLKALEDI